MRPSLRKQGRLRAVMGVTVFCEIRIPVPGLRRRELMMEMRPELERLLQ
jgi:hypothetical protein